MSKSPQYYTTHEVARMLGVSAPTVIKWIKQKRLQAHSTPGGHRRVSVAALEAFADEYDYPLLVTPEGTDSNDIASPRVLVIDGEPDFSEMVAEFLQLHLQCQVVAGGESLRVGYLAGSIRPDVVIYDVDCVAVDIQHLMSLIREQNTHCRLLLTTSLWSDAVDALQAELKPDSVIEKPFKLDILTDFIVNR